MISNIAKETINKWKSEGLDPSVDDIVNLNQLGLKIERGSDMYDFSCIPRMAYIGDICIFEPTILKKIWIDQAVQHIADDSMSRLYFLIYALYTDINDLPSLNDRNKIVKAVEDFTSDYLMNSTERQLIDVVNYVIYDEVITVDDDKQTDVYDVPEEVKSVAKQFYLTAINYGMDAKGLELATVPQVERLIYASVVQKGADVAKNERLQNTAKFYAYAAKVRQRLLEEKLKQTGN